MAALPVVFADPDGFGPTYPARVARSGRPNLRMKT
jgi:hypothetical protein